MIVRYENTLEDMVAFNRYHCAHSPAVRRTKLTWMVAVPALFIAASLFLPLSDEASRPRLVVTAVVFSVIFSTAYACTLPALMDRHARQTFKEGTNKGMLGQHEIEIHDRGFVERTEVNETRQSWQGVERIVDTDEYAFIYISSMMAHVIPKHGVTAGDPESFIARAKHLWLAANREAAARQE